MLTKNSILIVEDEAADALLLKRALNKVDSDLEVFTVEDGGAAIAALSPDPKTGDHQTPRFILLDLKLRKMDGLAVLETLKADKNLRNIPVVILTSSSDPDDIRRAYNMGANSYLVKPVKSAELSDLAEILTQYWVGTNTSYPMEHAF